MAAKNQIRVTSLILFCSLLWSGAAFCDDSRHSIGAYTGDYMVTLKHPLDEKDLRKLFEPIKIDIVRPMGRMIYLIRPVDKNVDLYQLRQIVKGSPDVEDIQANIKYRKLIENSEDEASPRKE